MTLAFRNFSRVHTFIAFKSCLFCSEPYLRHIVIFLGVGLRASPCHSLSFQNVSSACVAASGKTIFQPASRLEKLMEGLLGSSGGFGRKFPEGGLNFLEVALVWKFPYGNLPKQSSKKFASEPPKLLRSPSRSGSMRKLVAELS